MFQASFMCVNKRKTILAMANTTEGDIFSWDPDNLVWQSFTTPIAYSVYKWSILLFLIGFSQVIFLFGILFFVLIFCIPIILMFIHDLRIKFSKGYTKIGPAAERRILGQFFKLLGTIWHGHELIGTENIPDGPAVLYIYHGPLAIDGFYVSTKVQDVLNRQNRLLCPIGHKKGVDIFGYTRIFRTLNYSALNRQEFIERLNDGWQILTAIGGLEESRLSDSNYRICIENKFGIAHAVKAANGNIPILPVFTRNIQEAFWIPWYLRKLMKHLPKHYHAYITPAGGLPVKLTTYIGKEIAYDKSMTPEEIMDRLKIAMQTHIDTHQIVPGNKLRALRERFWWNKISPCYSL